MALITLSTLATLFTNNIQSVAYAQETMASRGNHYCVNMTSLIPVRNPMEVGGVEADGDVQIPIIYSVDASTSFDPDASAFTEGDESALSITSPKRYHNASRKISGVVKDVEKFGVRIENQEVELAKLFRAWEQMFVDYDKKLCGDGTGNGNLDFEGVLAYNKAAGTIGGRALGSHPFLAGYTEAVSGAIALDDIYDMVDSCCAASSGRAGAVEPVLIGPVGQWRKVHQLLEGVTGGNLIVDPKATTTTFSIGAEAIRIDNIPFFKVDGYTSTRIDLLDMSAFGRYPIQPGATIPLAKTAYWDEIAIVFGWWLFCTNPGANGSLTALS